MTGRENIVKNLEICASGCCEGCTYYKPGGMNLGCWNKLMSDAAKLLKEQEERIKKFELERSWDEYPDTMGKW